ncbi:MAG: AMP-dependent synthetase and ligase [Acidobacteria bacterium]|nr:AMP-dependent synthetase and ligase [Acidobacteriota bacterium]
MHPRSLRAPLRPYIPVPSPAKRGRGVRFVRRNRGAGASAPSRLPFCAYDSAVTLLHLFDVSLSLRRERVGLEWEGRTYTFGELESRSNRVAWALKARGLVKGDRLGVYLANRIELIDLFLASVKLGVIFVPINILYRDREIAHIVNDAEPRFVVDAEGLPQLFLEAEGQSEERPSETLDGETPAAIIYTSGTTGASKGAVLTHDNFAANAVNLTACWQVAEGDRFLLALPLFHIHALGNGLHCWLVSGCRMRLLERFDHRTALDELLDFRPTLFFGVPTIYVRLLETAPDVASTIGAAMRLFVSGSAPLPAQVLEAFRGLFGHTILERYGMTETFMTCSNPYAGERRAGTVGFPLPGISVRFDDGELFVRGPNVFRGYWRRPDATDAAFTADGWFRTGDLATRSDDGYYTLLGRRSDLIISGGFNIYPREIEELLLEQEGVREAAVVGEPDAVRGEVPVAYIVGDATGEALAAVCREQLASFKVPRRFERVEEIPRTALGKVQKHLLKR